MTTQILATVLNNLFLRLLYERKLAKQSKFYEKILIREVEKRVRAEEKLVMWQLSKNDRPPRRKNKH